MPSAPSVPASRNAPCPCGSGLRYKSCCGREAVAPAPSAAPAYPGWDSLPLARQRELQERLRQALGEHKAGRLPQARALYREVLATAPDTYDALHMLGIIGHGLGDLDEARACLLRALDLSDWSVPWMRENLKLVHTALDAADARPAPDGDDPTAEPPPITRQTAWDCGFFDLPVAEGEGWFNPGAIRIDGDLYLAVRRTVHQPRSNGIVFVQLDRDLRAVATTPLGGPSPYAGPHVEDGRCIPIPGAPDRLLLPATTWLDVDHQGQALFEVDRAFKVRREVRIEFGANAATLDKHRGMEKNWQFFHVGDRLHFVHRIRPDHVVCEVDGDRVVNAWKTPTVPPWRYGFASGGTPPVRIGALYWSFFHSYREFASARRRYYMGVYAFDAEPPFAVRHISRVPILAGTDAHPLALWQHRVVFPAGALFDATTDEWLLTLGVNDCRCAWMKIPHRELRDSVA